MTGGRFALVTGGAGFIGAHLCNALSRRGDTVISLDNDFNTSRTALLPAVIRRSGHTADIEQVVPEVPDLLFHLGEYSRAEKSFEEPGAVWRMNMAGTAAVLEYCRKAGRTKLIYAGSSTKFAECGPGRHQSPYAWSKAVNTELVRNYGAWYGVRYAIAYFYNVYGPGESAGSYGTVVEIFSQQAAAGIPLTVVAPGSQRRNFTHVDDVVGGLLLVADRGEGDNFGLGSEDCYSVLEVAQMFGGDVEMLPSRRGNRMSSRLDSRKSRRLGWTAAKRLVDYVAQVSLPSPAPHRDFERPQATGAAMGWQ
jgi:UDP-glucose 4-epimerase